MTVNDVFNRVVPKVKGPALCTIFEAIGAVQDVIVKILLLKRSDLLASDYDAKLSFVAGKNLRELPSEFIGLSDRPYLDGDGAKRLIPLPGQAKAGTGKGEPTHYRLKGRTLLVYPTPDVSTVIYAPFFARPEPVEQLADIVQFADSFEQVLIDGCVAVMSAAANRSVEEIVQQGVALVLTARDLADEQFLADAINGR